MTQLPVNSAIVVSSSDVISSICFRQSVLVTLILANNKFLPLQTVFNVAARLQEFQLMFHTDAVQVFQKVPVDLSGTQADSNMVMIVGHRFRDPKGKSALYVQPSCLVERM